MNLDMDFVISIFFIGLFQFCVGQKVTILPNERNVIKFQNESYFVSCQSSDNQIPQWTDNRHTRVQASEHSRIRVEHGLGLELYLNKIELDDAGVYTCNTASSRAGFNLTVIRPITFNPREAIQSAAEGENFRMKCTAQGHSSRPKIFWKVDQKLPAAPKYRVLNDGSLQIMSVTQHDANRNYVCRAMDMTPSKPDSKEMKVTLKVRIKPRPRGGDRVDNWGVIGEWTNLTCSVYAEPPVHFDWYHKGRKLSTSDEFILSTPEINVSILQVLVKHEQKFGLYMCSARNEMGSYNRTLQLKKGRKPPTPILETEHLGSVGIAIRARFKTDPERYRDPAADEDKRTGHDLPIVAYDVQYKMVTKSDWVRADVQKTSYGFILRGLLPNVTYLLKAAARNSASRGDFSKEFKFSTPRNVPFTPAAASRSMAASLSQIVALSILGRLLCSRF